jgi:hypothetical protein
MSDEKLVSIALEFCKAAARKEQKDPKYGDELMSSMDICQTMFHARHLSNMRRQFGDAVEKRPEYIKSLIIFADNLAADHLKVASKAEVAALISEKSKSREISDAFDKKGAASLAQLTRP